MLRDSMRRFAERLEGKVALSFIDGPHIVDPSPHLPVALPSGCNPRGWWVPERLQESGQWSYHGVDESLQAIAAAQRAQEVEYGHGFDGIVGFSQGSAMAHLVCALHEHGGGGPLPTLSCAILFGGFPFSPAAPRYSETSKTLHRVQSLHVHGRRDNIVKSATSKRLELCFAPHSRMCYQHDGGHVVHSGTASLDVYERWLNNLQ